MDTIVTPVTVITLDSTRIVHSIKTDLVARYFPPVVRLVQYDQSLPVIAVSLMQNGQTYTLPSGAAANIRVHKPDATYVYNPALGCDSTRKIVYFEVTQAMAAANGDGLAIVEIVVNGDIAGTSLITLHFEENPVPENAIESSDEWETIYELGERIIASTVTPVSTAAGMTDHNVVYLYTGTESGWNQGHMYYYNGTTWVDAGIASTDKTLSVENMAADAKKTGDEIADLKDGLDAVPDQINATLITDTASGAIASFPDGADNVPVKSLKVNVEPVQSGSGDPSPTNIRPISVRTQAKVTRTGKNLLHNTATTRTINGVTFTVNPDGSVKVSGTNTASSTTSLQLRDGLGWNLPVGEYTLSGTPSGGGAGTFFMSLYYNNNGGENWGKFDFGNGQTYTVTDTTKNLGCRIGIARGTTIDAVFYPMLRPSGTDPTFEPYQGGQIVTIDLGDTIYGGALDVTTGVLTVTHTYVDENAFGSVSSGTNAGGLHWVDTTTAVFDADKSSYCSMLTRKDGGAGWLTTSPCYSIGADKKVRIYCVESTTELFKSAYADLQIVCGSINSTEIQLSANDVKTLLGQNNIWSDAGDVDVEYRADTKLYIEKLTAPTEDDMIADHAISANTFFMVGNTLYRATTAIASGATITVGTNATKLSLSDALNILS